MYFLQLHCDHDANAFVCQPCWRKVDDFHRFYQSVLIVYQSHCWMQPPKQEDGLKDGDYFAVENKLDVVLTDDEPLAEPHYTDYDDIDDDVPLSDHDTDEHSSKHIDPDPQSNNAELPARKRGRPRKLIKTEPEPAIVETADCSTKRRPGRPRKSDAVVRTDLPHEQSFDDALKPTYRIARNRPQLIAEASKSDIDELVARYFTLQCDLCAAPNANLTVARAHHQQEHQQRGYLTCGCGQRFHSIDAVRKHCHFHADASEHKCDECCKTFANQQRLTMHRKFMHATAHSDEAEPAPIGYNSRVQQQRDDDLLSRYIRLDCGECGAPYATFSEARLHHLHVHGQRGYVECCGKKFVQKSRAVKHCQWHANPKQFE